MIMEPIIPPPPPVAAIGQMVEVAALARKKQETLVLFPEVLAVTRKFTDEQFGILIRAAFSYRFGGEVYAGDDVAVDVAFQVIANQIDRHREYCDTLADNASGSKREQNAAKHQQKPPPIHSVSHPYPIHSNPGESEADTTPPPPFKPPTHEEIKAYCAQNGLEVDADRFVDYYTSNGWMVGKNHMNDWKAAVRNWNRKDVDKQNGKNESKPLWTVGTVV